MSIEENIGNLKIRLSPYISIEKDKVFSIYNFFMFNFYIPMLDEFRFFEDNVIKFKSEKIYEY